MCQDILEASILPAVPSDKHMPGLEPRGEGKTTDAIQTTPSLLREPDQEDTLKNKCTQREQTGTILQTDSHGLTKTLNVHTASLCLGLITNMPVSSPTEPKEGF